MNQSSAILRMLAKQHGFYAEEPEKMWAIDSANDNFVDALTKIAPLVMGKKFDADGHKAYNAAVETIADYIHKNLHTHEGHMIAAKELTMADFTAASFIFGCVFNEAFPMQEWAKGA
jgi:glutathione S-transferase